MIPMSDLLVCLRTVSILSLELIDQRKDAHLRGTAGQLQRLLF